MEEIMKQILEEQKKTNEKLEAISNTNQIPKLLYAKDIAKLYRVNLNTATAFCKKHGNNFGGQCIEAEYFRHLLQTKGQNLLK